MNEPETNSPPWIRPDIQQHIKWRDQDIVISVPPKSGTTWTMNIVYQLLQGGNPEFDDVYEEVPWIEFLAHPEQPVREVVDRVEAMPEEIPRAFKTHSAPPEIPYLQTESGKDVRYIVIARNPEEALVSFKPFIEKHTEEWFDLWQAPRQAMTRETFPDFYYEVIDGMMGMQGMFFNFVSSWWPLRNESNVLLLHFADMKRDHAGSLRKIAEFLDIQPTEEQWQRIEELTGFDWMKQHTEKFEVTSASSVPVLERGAMVRKGKVGAAREDGMTPEIAAHLRSIGEAVCADQAALNWLYEGGEID